MSCSQHRTPLVLVRSGEHPWFHCQLGKGIEEVCSEREETTIIIHGAYGDFGRGKSRMTSTFSSRGRLPSLLTLCPRNCSVVAPK